MTINHHPSDETLLGLAAGTLGAGPALVVSVHLEGCAVCRHNLDRLEALGGAMLGDMQPVALAPDSFERTLARLQAPPRAPRPRQAIARDPNDLRMELPRALQDCKVGPWRWLGPGFQWSKVEIVGSPHEKVMLLKGKAGLHLPAHGHTGLEFMQILSGSLTDSRGQYLPGDLDEAGEDVDHQPVVDAGSDCVCLAALDGDIRLQSFLGRLMRPLVGF
jgi:putative transcriptional regulator